LAVTAIGEENASVCQPLEVSPVSVPVARIWPDDVHSEPVWVPVFADDL